jgi:hypothetical protein
MERVLNGLTLREKEKEKGGRHEKRRCDQASRVSYIGLYVFLDNRRLVLGSGGDVHHAQWHGASHLFVWVGWVGFGGLYER